MSVRFMSIVAARRGAPNGSVPCLNADPALRRGVLNQIKNTSRRIVGFWYRVVEARPGTKPPTRA